MRYLWVLVCLVGLLSCSPSVPPSITATAGKQFQLKLGQTAKLEDGLTVTFDDVPSDGRCSSCTASFYALINLHVTPPGKAPVLVSISTPPVSKIEGDIAPYQVQYIALTPQHNTPNDNLNRAEYAVTLVITKGE